MVRGTDQAVELPSGRTVRGRRIGVPPASRPDWGLYLGLTRPAVDWPSAWICWPDFGLPVLRREAWESIRTAWDMALEQRVEVACRGGIGRTGTALAAMCMLDGLTDREAIAWVRERYHARAVETPWQATWLTRGPGR
ncbi:protein-tyrosine-phosphatase [Arsenicicoccus piscis]|uniref:Protein-tyrosine-phosphatase n=1 Tax=Arsenicicoccus piscis TaxID=673954 RepID=A0ABQ6HSV9_9MICO|nr:protein-tyrosine-phosphatase [Arsenicicoccus piscis]